jgi:hypothetical protein
LPEDQEPIPPTEAAKATADESTQRSARCYPSLPLYIPSPPSDHSPGQEREIIDPPAVAPTEGGGGGGLTGMSQLLSETIGKIFHEKKSFIETVRERRKLRQQRLSALFQRFHLTSRDGPGEEKEGTVSEQQAYLEEGKRQREQTVSEELFQEEIERILNHDDDDEEEDLETLEEEGLKRGNGLKGTEEFQRDVVGERQDEGRGKESMTCQEIDDVQVWSSGGCP